MIKSNVGKYDRIGIDNSNVDRNNPYFNGSIGMELDDVIGEKNPTKKYLDTKFNNSDSPNSFVFLDKVDYPADNIGNDPSVEPVPVSNWNFREWEILSWVKAMIDTYKANKGDTESKENYLKAKDKMREVFDGKYADSLHIS